jgi:FkbM family methyltransferase
MLTTKNWYDGLIEKHAAPVIGFEPNSTEFDRLCNEGPGGCTWLPYFLGNSLEATFYQTRFPGCSSLYVPDPSGIDLFQTNGSGTPARNIYVVGTERVRTKRLDDIEECPEVDFIKIDVQGSELDIFKNGIETLKNVSVIQTEVEFIPIYKDQPLFGDIQIFLREQGFQLHKFIDVEGRCMRLFEIQQHPYSAMSQIFWADAIFIRDFSMLGGLSDEQLLKPAVILHDLYLSYDVVLFLQNQLDKRRGTNLSVSYNQALQKNGNVERLYINLKEHLDRVCP